MQANLNKRVYLLGLDFGSTTSSALVASAKVSCSSATGRMAFSEPCIVFRSEPVFTPFIKQSIDTNKIHSLIQHWLLQSGLTPNQIFSGGSIITGLAARSDNASALSKQIISIVGDSVIATADDPCLESWLAFMGSCSVLSRYHSALHFLNLDIGGGTTNAAIGVNGDVLTTGCYFIGARHIQFIPGSYQVLALSDIGLALLQSLNISANVGDTLTSEQRSVILDFYVSALEAIVLNDTDFFTTVNGQRHCQVALDMEPQTKTNSRPTSSANARPKLNPKITFSGGVGELIYQYNAKKPLPDTTYFGDFGIDLAIAITKSTILAKDLNRYIPENKGRATVYGLTLHSTEISGHTIYLPNLSTLPLNDIPVIAKLSLDSTDEMWQNAFNLAAHRQLGACIQLIDLNTTTSLHALDIIKLLALKIKHHYALSGYADTQALLILVEENIGKVLGNYISGWGQSMQNLIVIDEVPHRDAHFVNVGRLHQQMVPVSFFGMH